MTLDGASIVWADLDVDADDLTGASKEVQHRGEEHQPPAVRDSSLDDDVGLDAPDDLLERKDVLRELDDWNSRAIEIVSVPVAPGLPHEGRAELAQLGVVALRLNVFCTL